MSEYLLCTYPRLPMEVVFAAVEAYIGPKALATVAKEWGIEAADEPGGEVEPGLLQFKRIKTGSPLPEAFSKQVPWKWNVTTTHKITKTDEFGSEQAPTSPHALQKTPVPQEEAAQSFVRALIGALHAHLGAPLVKRFFRDHFLSRHLDVSTLFDFRTPTRDLSKLCAREGFEAPVARLISETGRLSSRRIQRRRQARRRRRQLPRRGTDTSSGIRTEGVVFVPARRGHSTQQHGGRGGH
jgi:dsRNA-specific ribonuclease